MSQHATIAPVQRAVTVAALIVPPPLRAAEANARVA